MISILGNKGAFTTTGIPYVSYVVIGHDADDVLNSLMQHLMDDILVNQDKNLVWREFPSIDDYDDLTYKAHARWCFE